MTVSRGAELDFDDLAGRTSANPLRGAGAASTMRIARPVRTQRRFAHRHPQSEEVIYVRTGHGAIFVDGAWHALSPGDTVHIPVGAAHATVPDEGGAMELVCFFPHPDLNANTEETDIDVMAQVNDE